MLYLSLLKKSEKHFGSANGFLWDNISNWLRNYRSNDFPRSSTKTTALSILPNLAKASYNLSFDIRGERFLTSIEVPWFANLTLIGLGWPRILHPRRPVLAVSASERFDIFTNAKAFPKRNMYIYIK